MKRLLAGLCLLLLSACAVYKDKEGMTHYEALPPPQVTYVPAQPPVYYAPPPPPPVYYASPPPPGYYVPAQPPAVYFEGGGGGGGRNPEHERSKRVQANCNTAWTGCANVCNTLHDPNQRALCISNCNNARNQCIRKNLGY